jgi:hypothetical protein
VTDSTTSDTQTPVSFVDSDIIQRIDPRLLAGGPRTAKKVKVARQAPLSITSGGLGAALRCAAALLFLGVD